MGRTSGGPVKPSVEGFVIGPVETVGVVDPVGKTDGDPGVEK